jgi:hypothetical protein
MGAKLSIFDMTNADIQKRIRLLAQDSSNVFFTEHVQDRMLLRMVSDFEVLDCLRGGVIQRPPKLDRQTGDLKCQMEHFGSSRNLAVIVALSDLDPDLLVVTVMTRSR